MKKIVYLVVFIAFISVQSFQVVAQQNSKILIKNIFWVADNDTINQTQAIKGVVMPEHLSLVIQFEDGQTLDSEKFEYKWFRHGATRDLMVNSFIRETEQKPNGLAEISSGRGSLKKGWWKVNIEAYSDRKLLAYKNKNEFWILLK